MSRRQFDDYDAQEWREEHERADKERRKREAKKQRHHLDVGCNYATASSGCNQFGTSFPCPSTMPAPMVTAGDVVFIVVENWSNMSTTYSLDLGPAPAAQTGPPDGTITAAGPFCDTDAAFQMTAVDVGGTWSGTGVSPTGLFDPAVAGVGTHTITYSIGSAPCVGAGTTTVTVTLCTSCVMDGLTVAMTNCYVNPVGNLLQYDVDATLSFTDPPTTGTLTVIDCNGGSQTFNAPFTSPMVISFTGLPQTGTNCDFTATFSDDLACTITTGFMAPPPITAFSSFCNIGSGAVSGTIDFANAPNPGSLVVSITDGTTTIDTTLVMPLPSPQNWSVSGLDPSANPYTITYYFAGFQSCAQTTTINCGCSADGGTSTAGITGDGLNNYVLCDGDVLDIVNNGDHTDPDDFGAVEYPGGSGNFWPYAPEIWYLVYSCPPTPGLYPASDPCILNVIPAPVNDLNDQLSSWAAAFGLNTLYYTPITIYTVDGVSGSPLILLNCWDIGDLYQVDYLTPITNVVTPNCSNATLDVVLNGGYPAMFGGNYTASNLQINGAAATTQAFGNTTCGLGGTIQITGMQNGDMYSFTITDDNGCPITITGGPFVGMPTAVAGPDDSICALTYTMQAVASFGIGAWTGTGGAVFGTPGSATSTVTVPAAGSYTMTWTETSEPGCASTDDVVIW
ncbi:MAG: hypothetical protein COB15_12385, partial [Flavobacteriales bacterium]